MSTEIYGAYTPEEMIGTITFTDFRTGVKLKLKGNLKMFAITQEKAIPALEMDQLEKCQHPEKTTGYRVEMEFYPEKFKNTETSIVMRRKK